MTTPALPIVGGSSGLWGNELNAYIEAMQAPPPAPTGDTSGASDVVALQTFINGLPAGATVQFNGGAQYYINAALTVNKAMTFTGGGTITQVTANTAGIVVTYGPFVWDGPALVGPQHTAYQSVSSAITVSGASVTAPVSFVRIRNSSISNWGAWGIKAQYVNDIIVFDNDIYNIQYAGCMFLTCNNGQISKNRISNIIGSASNGGNAYAISLSESVTGTYSTDPTCQNISIEGNVITNVPQWTGIDMHGATNVTIANNIVQGCNFGIAVISSHGSGAYGLYGPHRIKVTGNVIDVGALGVGQGTYGIIIQGQMGAGPPMLDPGTGISVTGNDIAGYGLPGTTGTGGLIASYTTGLVVNGNTFESCTPEAINLDYYNYAVNIGPNTITDTWDNNTSANNAAIIAWNGYSTGVIHAQAIYAPGLVLAEAVIGAASIGTAVSAVTVLSLYAPPAPSALGSPSGAFAATGSVTVPTSTGTAVLAYTSVTATTLTGVTLTSGTGNITAGFATQSPLHLNTTGYYNDASTNSLTYYRGHCEAAIEITDIYQTTFIPNFPVLYVAKNGTYTTPVPAGSAWLEIELAGPGGGGGGGGAAALTGGTNSQAGGSAGGSGGYVRRGFPITPAMWGSTITVTPPIGGSGGDGGAASTGAMGNAGLAGTSILRAEVQGSGTASGIVVVASGGGAGQPGAANSSTPVAGGNYTAYASALGLGQGGVSGGAGTPAFGLTGGASGGGGFATANLGGGPGGTGSVGSFGTAGVTGASSTPSGQNGGVPANPGVGGQGGGGGAPGGAGGNGGEGGPAQAILTWS